MRYANRVLSLFVTMTLLPSMSSRADDNWPSFRGASRSAVANESGLLSEWPADGPKLLWTGDGAGKGYASLAISDGKIYTVGDGLSTASDTDEYLVCFDQETGKQLWKSKTGAPWTDGKPDWQSSRSTPTVDADRVYVVTGHGDLICFKTSGDEVWRKHFKDDFGGKKADSWGYSESVLIDGDRLVCTPGGPENTVVALHKMNGDPLWSTPHADDRGAGHASIVISDIGGTRVYVQTTGSGALGIRAEDGKLLWSYDIKETTAVIPTPIVKEDLVFFTAGYGTGGTLVQQVPTSDGVEAKEIYPTNPALGNKHGGMVLVGDHLYGDSEDRGTPFCADLMTGEVKWKSRGSGSKSASVVAADGNLYFRFSDGTMAMAKASPEAYEESGSFKIPGSGERPSWAHPVIVSGKLYLREGDKVLCYDLKG
jgi:outer membrane protein assembly factor BamB